MRGFRLAEPYFDWSLRVSDNSNVLNVTDADFESTVLQSSEPVLVDLWAPWCGPCRMIGPVVEEMADTYAGKVKVAKVNVDDNPQVSLRYHVRSIPTVLMFKDGQIVDTLIGAPGNVRSVLTQMIDKTL